MCQRLRSLRLIPLVMIALLHAPDSARAQEANIEAAVTVVASGLTNPRGFAWGPDNSLYVVLAGEDNVQSSVVRIADGCPVSVAGGLSAGALPEPGWMSGVADLAFVHDHLYVLVDGIGATDPETPNGVYRIQGDGTPTLIADLTAWFRANPARVSQANISPDARPSAMVSDGQRFWILDANHHQVVTVTRDGAVAHIADLSGLDNVIPSGIVTAPAGGVYVGLSTLPAAEGTDRVVHVAEHGAVTDVWTGLTAVSAIVVDERGQLYALQLASGAPDPQGTAPGTGSVVLQTGIDTSDVIANRMDFPTEMQVGPEGDLYVASPGIRTNAGAGTIIRLTIAPAEVAMVANAHASGDGCD